MTTKYPNITVRFMGQPRQPFPILAAVRAALRESEIPASEIAAFTAEATSGDFDHLMTVAHRWVNIQQMFPTSR